MKIDRTNYEAYFLDFLEGNLDEAYIDQFLDFLEKNPDLKEELHLFEQVELPAEKIEYSGKEDLYKSKSKQISFQENSFVAHLENDSTPAERQSFETWLAANPDMQKEYKLYTQTKLIPESGIIFPDKRKLYRKAGTVVWIKWVARVAAAVIVLWGIGTVLQPEIPTSQQFVQKEIIRNETPVSVAESVPATSEIKAPEKPLASSVKMPVKITSIPETKVEIAAISDYEETDLNQREVLVIPEITPIYAQLEPVRFVIGLEETPIVKLTKINEKEDVLTLDEFLALRAKKVGNEGLMSAQRIVRAGLGLASELSGERIGYGVKNGKISSLEFETKLLAFSIPLEKK